jgi:hypothetical protein
MFEIKVACPGRSWEETPVFITGNECFATYDTGKQAALVHAIATAVARIFCDEVRWNWQGSLQGHYVSPNEYHREVNHVTSTLTSKY